MRIALVGPAPPFRGGIARHTAALSRALAAAGDEVLPVPFRRLYPARLFPGTSQLEPGATDPGQGGLDPYRPRSWAAATARIAAGEPDLVLVQWWHPWFTPVTAGILTQLRLRLRGTAKLAVVVHNVLPHRPFPLQRWLTRGVMARAGRAVVHAESESRRLAAIAPRLPQHRLDLPSTLDDMPRLCPIEARARLGLADRPWLLFFGLLRDYKGVDDLLAAMRLLPPAVGLLLVGETYGDEKALRARIARLGLGERVHRVARYVPDAEVPAWFAAGDVLVLPYRRATQSAVLTLGIGFRRRLVVTDVGGIGEFARDVAEVVPPCRPAELAAGIERALAHPPGDDAALAALAQRVGDPALAAGVREVAAAAARAHVEVGAA